MKLIETVISEMPVKPQTAEKEYEKNPDIKKEDIVALKQWMERQPHLPTIPGIQPFR
jgi:hypothetical protein